MKDFTKVAASYVGIRQGSKRHKKIIDYYNTYIIPLPRGYKVKYTDNWCATFVSVILKKSGCTSNVFECGAHKMKQKMKSFLITDKTKGKKNDIIFYDWDGNEWTDHVGIIYRSDKYYYYVIEGNKNRQVGVRKIIKNNSTIVGIARIKK